MDNWALSVANWSLSVTDWDLGPQIAVSVVHVTGWALVRPTGPPVESIEQCRVRGVWCLHGPLMGSIKE